MTSLSSKTPRTAAAAAAAILWLLVVLALFGAAGSFPICAVPAVFLGSALLGSIPWGVIISKAFYHTDLRDHGSGNIGTTNALRTMGKAGGAAVFALDFGKGLASGGLALAGLALFDPGVSSPLSHDLLVALAFLGCIWGHIFSPWLGFKGGKGIAVAVGCLFVTFGAGGALFELALFAVVVAATRYVSLGSLAAAVACPFYALYRFPDSPPAVFLCVLAAATVIWAHRENIARLRAGTETA